MLRGSKMITIPQPQETKDPTHYQWRFPSFIDLFKTQDFSGSMLKLLDSSQNRITEFVKFTNWIDSNNEKSQFSDPLKFKDPKIGNTSPYSLENSNTVLWLFKFVFSTEDFWLRRAAWFEYKLALVRFIDRLKEKYSMQLSAMTNKITAKMIEKGELSSRESVFHLCAFLALHEYYFILKHGRPKKLLSELEDEEWVEVIQSFLQRKAIPVRKYYGEAEVGFSIDFLYKRFDDEMKRRESEINKSKGFLLLKELRRNYMLIFYLEKK